jgi:hypothetical protein
MRVQLTNIHNLSRLKTWEGQEKNNPIRIICLRCGKRGRVVNFTPIQANIRKSLIFI